MILLAAYLAIGGIYIVIAFRHEPFYERLATLLLVSSYDWFDPLIIGACVREAGYEHLTCGLVSERPTSVSICRSDFAVLYHLLAGRARISRGVVTRWAEFECPKNPLSFQKQTTDPVRLSTTLSGMARRHLVIMGYGNLGRRVVNWALEQGR